MRYSKDHKAKTRARILSVAAKLFKKQGIQSTTIDQIMNRAGLTRGGFYAHFRSKQDLVIEIFKMKSGLLRMLSDRNGTDAEELNKQTIDIFRTYLDPKNRRKVGTTCTLATMPMESARGSARIRKAYTNRLESILHKLEQGRNKSRVERQRLLKAAILAIGGIILSRATDNSAIARDIEAVSLEEIESLLNIKN